jgi:hypothetical protein
MAKYCPENVKMKRAYAFFLETAEGIGRVRMIALVRKKRFSTCSKSR